MNKELNNKLLDFIQKSPTPYHAVHQMTQQFIQAGFKRLTEDQAWNIEVGQGYIIHRHQSSLIAFVPGNNLMEGWRIIGTHTDSPCLKVKPRPELNQQGYFQLGVETYGGVLLHPWFDRDLGLAGNICYQTSDHHLRHTLINFNHAIAIIPSLAIHLDREANTNHSINPQRDIPPILLQSDNKLDWYSLLLNQLKIQSSEEADTIHKIVDFDLYFYDIQPPALIGLNLDFIASARLDNLLSCFIGMDSLIQASRHSLSQGCLLICSDHEEVGSQSACGAQSPFLESILKRVCAKLSYQANNSYWKDENYYRIIDRSWLISVDNAHGVHPNFSDRHDSQHSPRLNHGPVIKINANQRYATSSETSAMIKQIAETKGLPLQTFVTRTDLGCGSTIGPIIAGNIGIRTIDIGVPTLAMHSIRELAGTQDTDYLNQLLIQYYQQDHIGVS